ncbi:MAG: hypothetical protein OEL53_06810 [Rhodospirillales bacterium]|nr:hypothetical protein [Rhodospirillales bacterium]
MIKFLRALSAILVFILFLWLLFVFISNFSQTDSNVKAGLIGFLGAITAGLITHYQTKKREVSARLFIEKREGYRHLVDLIFELLLASKRQRTLTEDEMLEKMIPFKKALFFWGEASAISAWNSFEMNFGKGLAAEEILHEIEKVMRAIRKDLGHDDNLLPNGQLIALILNSDAKDLALRRAS